ncbi:MAG: DNA-directed RNA polymerase subunit D [Candidatus Hydrothermarchaeaceae archaeon]
MKLKIIEKNKSSLVAIFEDTDVSIINALRRTAISEVPTLAIESVDIIENTSSFYDEIIAHRLAMIPIKTDLKLFNFRDECSCKKGCASCTLKLTLKKTGPCLVYSHDMKSNAKLKPIPNIPILKLGKGQKISFEAEAVLGTGKMHARWQPAVASYKYYPEIKVDANCTLCNACVDACPRNILKISGKKLKVTDEKDCTLCDSCVETCDQDAIKVSGKERKFIMKIESVGSLKPEQIINKSSEILRDKIRTMKALL